MILDSWEYKVVHFGAEYWTKTGLPNDLNMRLDRYGEQGWELVSVHTLTRPTIFPFGSSKTAAIIVYLKRRMSK